MSFNKNLQNFAPTSDTLPCPDKNFVIELSTNFNNEPNTEEQFFKYNKNAHPIWNYFKPTPDKKIILYSLCSKTKYSTGSDI
ncbi:6587_t:CDS:1, partial [Racocetra persica]